MSCDMIEGINGFLTANEDGGFSFIPDIGRLLPDADMEFIEDNDVVIQWPASAPGGDTVFLVSTANAETEIAELWGWDNVELWLDGYVKGLAIAAKEQDDEDDEDEDENEDGPQEP